MIKIYEDSPESLLRTSILLSILIHALLMGGFYLRNLFWDGFPDHTIEIDLTKPFRIGGNPLLKPGGGNLAVPPKKAGVPKKSESEIKPEPAAEPEAPKDWVLPGPDTQVLEKPVQESIPKEEESPEGVPDGRGEGFEGTGGPWGGGDGEGGGVPVTSFPKLLNRRKVLRLLRRNYPLIEKQAGRNGEVIVDLHLNVKGRVTGVEIVDSAGSAFDRVALSVARQMRFSPALIQKKPVPVKIRQAIVFKLEDLE